ncbi:MAG: type II toxin-antitoxin system Phd/YefM family antitoxin [SAR202 cluster bacterium]|nr:type II toxin-antitoxin system Phd/YefM family antitoxin [SAR202 cluster bacterium]
MGEREPATMTMKASDARQQFSEVINEVFRKEARIIVEKSGIPVAAIVSVEDLERVKYLEERRRVSFKALDALREAFAEVPDDELEAEVEKAVQSARRRARHEAGSRQKS